MGTTSSFKLADGTITSATSIVGPFDVSQASTATINLFGTHQGINVTFEGSIDGTNWFSLSAAQAGGGGVANGATGVLTNNSSNAWDVTVGAFIQFRVRATAWTSGTGTVQVALGNTAYEPSPNVQIAVSDVTVQGDVASGSADSGNPVKIAGVNHTTLPTLADGQRGDAQMDTRGGLFVVLKGINGTAGAGLNTPSDGFSALSSLTVTGCESFYNGASWDRVRTPTVFKTVSATASGNTALWTPTAGKKFRLQRLLFDLTSNASRAAGAVTTFSLQDSATDIGVTFDVFVPTAAVTTGFGGYTSGWIDLGNGVLSSTINNVLNLNLSAALATGVCRVTACGTEE